MSGRWWRAYSRARHDPKLLKLSDRQFRWWFNLVCVAADNNGILPSHADLAVEFRVAGKTMTEALDALVSAGLLDHDATGIHPHNWNGLQYKHDVSTERVKRFRKRRETVSETRSETETETDTETDTVAGATVARAPKARMIPDGWGPSETAVATLRKGRPDLIGEYYDERMQAFRRWCKAKLVLTHDPESTWLDFMLGSYVRGGPAGESNDQRKDREIREAIARSKLQ